MTTPGKKPQFLLLLNQPAHGPGPTPQELQEIMGRFMVWMTGLKAKGVVLGTNGLEDTSKVLRGPRGKFTSDGPFAESKEIVGGYVLIEADNFDQAIEIARDCPGLDYRLSVEVRPVRQRPE
jgi:hypothetical protein